ncbi:MAG TPA: hypothetical protein DCZ75_11295 [Geobacter sp.]|nr:hypothetical protein [Geobacter sp.]
MMAAEPTELLLLMGVVELDENTSAGAPDFKEGVKHKRGGRAAKQCIAVAVERENGHKWEASLAFCTSAEDEHEVRRTAF